MHRKMRLRATIAILLLLLAIVACYLGWSQVAWRNAYNHHRRESYWRELQDLRDRSPGGWFIQFSLPQDIPSSEIQIIINGRAVTLQRFDMECPPYERRGPIVLATVEQVEGSVDLGKDGRFPFRAERQAKVASPGLKVCYVSLARNVGGVLSMNVVSGNGPEM